MGSELVILGAAVVGFLFLYLSFQLDEEHYILKILLLFVFVGSTIMIGKAVLDEKDYCTWNVVNSTTVGNTDYYSYEHQCSVNENNTNLQFFEGLMWFAGIFFLYAFGYFTYRVFVFLGWVVPGGGKE